MNNANPYPEVPRRTRLRTFVNSTPHFATVEEGVEAELPSFSFIIPQQGRYLVYSPAGIHNRTIYNWEL